jgi:hypothetical protein
VQSAVFGWLGALLTNLYIKASVLMVTAAFLAAGLWGTAHLTQEFDPAWFLPQGTYLADWFHYNKELFPGDGELGTVYFSGTPLPAELGQVQGLVDGLANRTDIIRTMDSWTTSYASWLAASSLLEPGAPLHSLDNTTFRRTLVQFLFSPEGAAYQGSFTFSSQLQCGGELPEVLLFKVSYTHRLFSRSWDGIPAMNAVKDAIKRSGIPGRVFAMAYAYSAWETDEVITFELYRNILLAACCVFLITLLFTCDLVGALMIITCVIFTLINVGGFMHFWGLTIDTVSCNNLIIAIGLCVDYSAHVTHRFLGERGSRDQRAIAAVTNIGPAVFNGGFSTFLAFILLASSKSHVFITFFKIFFLVVSFGLFHGLIFLPVLLSLVGPKSHNKLELETAEMATML